MMKLTLFRLTLGLTLLSVACSSDDNKSSGGGAGTSGTNGGAGKGGGAAAGSGKGAEGVDCMTDTDCGSGLNCIEADSVAVSSTQAVLITVCARKCKEDTDCKTDEMCFSSSGKPADAMCWSLTKEANKPCGPADTSFCDTDLNLRCVIMPSSTSDSLAGGLCVQLCEVASPSCPTGLECLFSTGTQGACAKKLNRGDECNSDEFADCATTDACIGDGTTALCFQDCTDTKMCDDSGAMCMALPDGSGSFCM